MTRPRLLFCTSRFPYPVIGGDRLRVFNLIRQLSKRYDVTLLALGEASAEDQTALIERSGARSVECVPHGRITALRGSLRALLTGLPLQVGYYDSPALAKRVDEELPNHQIAIFHLIRTSSMWRGQAKVPAVLEMCDAISENFAQTAREGPWWSPWRLVSALEAPRTASFERNESKRFDLVSLHTHKDARLVGIPDERLLVSTQGVDLTRLAFRAPSTRHGRAIALIGKMDFFPNWHGAEWFAREVLPKLPDDIRLKVVGDCSPKIRARLEALPRVEVTGRVDSLAEACDDAFAAIAPMQVATGIQNKVLEYFAMGLPTVVSPSVASGLLPTAEGGYMAAGNAAEWAIALARIAEDPAACDAMANLARSYAIREHAWDQIGDDYVERLEYLLQTHAHAAHQTTPAGSLS